MKKIITTTLFVLVALLSYSEESKLEKQENMILVEGGSLLSNFYISKYEVTQWEFTTLMGFNPSNSIGSEKPVEQVTWFDAIMFCNKLSEKENLVPYYNMDKIVREYHSIVFAVVTENRGKGYRLLTEKEWEYAARGGNKSKGYEYSGSNIIDEVAEYKENNNKTTKPVGGKKPNELGIYDMTGNVWEWCQEWYDSNNAYRVLRGGSWSNDKETCLISNRGCYNPDYSDNRYAGIRVGRFQ